MPRTKILNTDLFFEVYIYGSINLEKQYMQATIWTG